jgi:hypothetical protein
VTEAQITSRSSLDKEEEVLVVVEEEAVEEEVVVEEVVDKVRVGVIFKITCQKDFFDHSSRPNTYAIL